MKAEHQSELEKLMAQYQSKLDEKESVSNTIKEMRDELEHLKEEHPRQINQAKQNIVEAREKIEEYKQLTLEVNQDIKNIKERLGKN